MVFKSIKRILIAGMDIKSNPIIRGRKSVLHSTTMILNNSSLGNLISSIIRSGIHNERLLQGREYEMQVSFYPVDPADERSITTHSKPRQAL